MKMTKKTIALGVAIIVAAWAIWSVLKPAPAEAAEVGFTLGAERKIEAETNAMYLDTNFGEIVIKLDALNAPVTVENFLNYVKSNHYDNTMFHRVIKDFMIQGGGFSSEGDEKETVEPIKNEGKNGLTNKRGSIAMARTNDPNSATSQFFINTVDNSRTLDAGGANGPDGYAVFGEVISGMETVDKIATVRVGPKTLKSKAPNGQLYPSPNGDVPVENVLIKTLKIKSED